MPSGSTTALILFDIPEANTKKNYYIVQGAKVWSAKGPYLLE
jgi:hypothetical protein